MKTRFFDILEKKKITLPENAYRSCPNGYLSPENATLAEAKIISISEEQVREKVKTYKKNRG